MKELIFKNKTAVVILLIVIISSTIYMLWNKSEDGEQELKPNFIQILPFIKKKYV